MACLLIGLTLESRAEPQIPTTATQKFLAGIREHNFTKVDDALKEGADINFHYEASDADFSLTDWTPLMKAIAELAYVLVTCQCRLNGVMLFGSDTIKEEYKKNISNLILIIKNLLQQSGLDRTYQGIKGRSASLLCKHALELLSAKTLIPPYTTRTPEENFTKALTDLTQQLPISELTHPSQAYQLVRGTTSPMFRRDGIFEPIPQCYKFPFVFDPNYDISAYGIEKLHPFDAKKYGKVWNLLKEKLGLTAENIYTPEIVSNADIELVHTPKYVSSLQNSTTLGILADMDSLGWLPDSFIQKILLDPVKLATGGTLLATDLALRYGWAINIAGGYHHAKSRELVRGFCIINDISIAAKKILIKHPHFRILIVDLDAHQGNGHEEISMHEKNIAIFDMYNVDTWPGDYPCQERINFDYPLPAKTKDAEYLQLLTQELPKTFDSVKPDLVIYNAGTDVYEEDPLGMLSISRQAIVQRDEFVFQESIKRNVPIVMVLSGGYHSQSYSIIAQSIENLWKKLLIHTYEPVHEI